MPIFSNKITSKIIFDRSYEALGTWRKVTRLRLVEIGTSQSDTFIFTPEKKQLRSSVELINYLSKNPKYWPIFDATLINFEKNNMENPSFSTKRVINFLNEVNNGVDIETAMSMFSGSKSNKVTKCVGKTKNTNETILSNKVKKDPEIPVIGNGNILTKNEVQNQEKSTCCQTSCGSKQTY